eukprot:scaffold3560_cov124-Isochrysis_galbana.AAC.4
MVFLLLLVCLCTDHWHWLGTAPRTGTGTWHWQTGTLTLAPRVLAVHARGTVPITLGHWVTCTCACQLVLVVRRWVLVLEQRSTQHAFVCVLLGCPAVTPLSKRDGRWVDGATGGVPEPSHSSSLRRRSGHVPRAI